MSSFLKRSLSGLVYVILFVSAILYSEDTYLILTSILALSCLFEFQKLIHFKGYVSYILLLGVIYYIAFLAAIPELNQILLALTLVSSLQLIFYIFSSKKSYPSNFLQKLDIAFRYMVLSFGFLLMLPFINGSYEHEIVLSLAIFIWTNDSFAYLVGKNFGKHKLLEKVSPKKTIEGFIGGIVFSVIAGIVVSFYFEIFSITNWIILSLIASVLGTVGDLVESKFKRQAKVKDSGNIMPGHGGLLDRLDSLLFVAPFVYLYIHYLI